MTEMITALIGLPASGKSTVRKMFQDRGYFVLDADRLAHQELERLRPELEILFDIQNDGQPVDRKKLAGIVFNNNNGELDILEALIHPRVIVEILKQSKGHEKVLAEVPILRREYVRYFDRVVIVDSLFEDRLERAKLRGWTEDDLSKRERRCPRPLAGIVLMNTHDLAYLESQVERIV